MVNGDACPECGAAWEEDCTDDCVYGTSAQPPATARQEGGDHYRSLPIQPIEYIIKNGLDFCEGNVIKYVTRWKSKGGVEDLRKARHYIDLLIESTGE